MFKKHGETLAFLVLLFFLTSVVLSYSLVKAKRVIDSFHAEASVTAEKQSALVDSYRNCIADLETELKQQKDLLSEYKSSLDEAGAKYQQLLAEKNETEELVELMTPSYNNWNAYVDRHYKASRSDIQRKQDMEFSDARTMRITAYTEYECDKEPDHPFFGVTASGKTVREWFTIAAGSDIPFGTRIYIPYFKDKPNNGIFVVEDRGGAIKENCIDVYMSDQKKVDKFGCKWLDVYVIGD